MPTQTYTTPNGSTLRLSWEGKYQSFTVYLNEAQIGAPSDRLRDGLQLLTADGHQINIQLLKSQLFSGNQVLQVSWDHIPLPGTETANHLAVKDAQGCAGLMVLVSTIFGFLLLTLLGQSEIILSSLALTTICLVLYFFIRRGVFLALLAFIIIYALDTLIFFGRSLGPAMQTGVITLVLRGLALVVLIKGALAMNRLRKKDEEGN